MCGGIFLRAESGRIPELLFVELLAKLPARPVFCLLEADFVVEGLGLGATSWYVVFPQ